ncbi:MAG: leucine-rich repeat domain-containing protein [Planctomycetaceae bacterium]|nr:leucine-rich repeat domain-containing protein [Planctomycetaceae bacterium]
MNDVAPDDPAELTRFQRWRYSSLFFPSLILMLLVVVFVGAMGREYYRRYAVHRYVSQLGGSVHEVSTAEYWLLRSYVSQRGTDDIYKRYYKVDLSAQEVSPEELAELVSRMQALETGFKLDFTLASLSKIDFTLLNRVQNVKSLNLTQTKLTEAQLDQIGKLRQLVSLDLSRNELTSSSIEVLSKMPNLHALLLDHVPLTDEQLIKLGEMGSLESLSITDSGVTEDTVIKFGTDHPQIEISDD